MKLPFGPRGNASGSGSKLADSNSSPEEPIFVFDVPILDQDNTRVERRAKCGIYIDFFGCRERDGSVSKHRYSDLELGQLIDATPKDAGAKGDQEPAKPFWLYVRSNPSISWIIYDMNIPELGTTLYGWLESRIPYKRPKVDADRFVGNAEEKLLGVLADRYSVEKLENGTALCIFIIREKGGRFSSKKALTVKLFPYKASWEIGIHDNKYTPLAKQLKAVLPASDADYRVG